MKKALVSPGYGAGWSTWHPGKDREEFLLFYEPIIEYLENDGEKDDPEWEDLLARVEREFEEKFSAGLYTGGARDLVVVRIDDDVAFRVHEYDGFETVEYRDSMVWH